MSTPDGLSYDTLAAKKSGNIIKPTSSALFLAPRSAPLVDTIVDAQGQIQELPEGYAPVGWVDGDDGMTWTRDTDTSDVIGHGSAYPVRSDITQDTTTMQAKLLETNAQTLGLFHNVVDPQATLDSANRTVRIDQSPQPVKINYRFLAIGRDGAGPSAIYLVKFMPSATISEYGDQTWNNEDLPGWDVTLKAEPDDDAGFAVRTLVCGPGLTDERLTAMGFTTQPASEPAA